MTSLFRAFIAAAALMFAAPAFADTPVTLRMRIEATGPAVTIGDVFNGAGADVAGRAIAPAPAPGQMASLDTQFLAAAAQSAGLSFQPPAGVSSVRVVRPGGMAATLSPASASATSSAGRPMIADAVVRRGDAVAIVYQTPGVQLIARGRALEDGAVGQSVRITNTASNRTIDATITGPGAATVSPN